MLRNPGDCRCLSQRSTFSKANTAHRCLWVFRPRTSSSSFTCCLVASFVLAYSDDLTLLEITFISGRPKEKKLRLLKALNDNIVAAVGISSDDLMITLYETPGENISFGRGLAQRAHISDRSCRRHTGLLRTAPPGPGRDDEINGWTYIAPIQTFFHE
jgi:hypothetical protein